MVLAADYPFLSIMESMLVFFVWVIWIWLLITVFSDLFRRHDTGGGAKVLWMIFVIVLPFLGVFIYLIAEQPRDGRAQCRTSGGSTTAVRQLRAVGCLHGRLGCGDREGQGAARQWRYHAGGVRGAQAEGPVLTPG